MDNVRIEGGKIYSNSSLCEQSYIFKIVNKIPKGFFVWNIGENVGTREYIPICESSRPGEKDCYDVNQDTLKAIHVSKEEWERLSKAASWGVNSLDKAEKAIKSKRNSYMANRKKEVAESVIDIFRKISD